MRAVVPGLTFDAAAHRYALNGRPMLGVTSILRDAGLDAGFGYREEPRLEGEYVHAALALDHEGALDDDTLDDRLIPYVSGWRWLKDELAIVPIAWETMVCDPARGYAGTFDLLATVNGRVALIDYKRRKRPLTAAQTAAYVAALPFPAFGLPTTLPHRFCLTWTESLRPDLVEFPVSEYLRDRARFYAALEVVKWKHELGLLT